MTKGGVYVYFEFSQTILLFEEEENESKENLV